MGLVFELAALPDTLLKHLGDHDARIRTAADDDSDGLNFHWRWGNPLFRDSFRVP